MQYRVELTQTVLETATMFVEANTAAEAEKIALRELDHAHWKFADAMDVAEVVNVELVKEPAA